MEPSTERAARAERNLKDRYTFGVAAHRLSCKQYALVAQSAEHRTFNARVRSSSLRRRTTPPWPDSQAVKTPPFHGGSTGSNPVRVTNMSKWRNWQTRPAQTRDPFAALWVRFPPWTPCGAIWPASMLPVAQLVRALDCGSRGRRFESGRAPHAPMDKRLSPRPLKAVSWVRSPLGVPYGTVAYEVGAPV